MGRFDSTKTAINVNITQNGNQEITGSILNSVLNNMVDATDAQLDILQETIPTKLSDLEQDIPIGSYDDTELRERIEENEVLIEDLQNTKIDKEADDYYPQLAVGLADNLSGVDVVDSEVNFRRSGGGAISDGVARIEAIKGNSVVWNQLYKPRKEELGTQVENGVTFIVSEDGTVQAEGTADGASAVCELCVYADFKSSHKYILIAIGAPEGKWSRQGLYFSGNNLGVINTYTMIGSEGYKIFQPQGEGKKATITLTAWAGYSLSCSFRPQFYDLTQMFGAGNEPTTIEEFYARIPMGVDLNAYNKGEVIHMDVQSIESQGVNAWDEEWENGSFNTTTGENIAFPNLWRTKNLIRVMPNTQYRVVIPQGGIWVMLLDADKKVIEGFNGSVIGMSGNSFFVGNTNLNFKTAPSAMWMKFYVTKEYQSSTYNHDICINISDASINGKYFPYIKRIEDLSIIRKYFPQGMKSAGSAHDEIRYNKETQKWEYSKGRFRSVDLGTMNWRLSGGVRMVAPGGFASASYNSNVNVSNILTKKYITLPYNSESQPSVYKGDTGIALFKDGGEYYLSVYDTAYTDAETFKADLQGVMLYYESNDWEWEELDAEDQFKDLDYQVWNCGTEKAIAEGKSAPLAADITYGFNAIGKIKELESLVAALRAKVGI